MSTIERSSPTSASRPTSGVRARCRDPGGADAASARQAATGSERPRTVWSPNASYWIECSVVACVSGPTITQPGSAAVCSRLAVFTTSPIAV